MLLAYALRRAATTSPSRAAVVADGGSLTYAELVVAASARAARLAADGIVSGDRVGLHATLDVDCVVEFWGVVLLGATVVPLDPRWSAAERAVRAASCDLVLADRGGREEVTPGGGAGEPSALQAAARSNATSTHDVAVELTTSGTAGAPKAVALSHANWWWSAAASAVALGSAAHERWLCTLPLSHVGGLSTLTRATVLGTTVLLHSRFEADRVVAAVGGSDGVTGMSVVPTMLARLIDAGLTRTGRLQTVLVGGAPLHPDLAARANAAGLPIRETYGMTEACSQVFTDGVPMFCTRLRRDADNELFVRGPTVAAASTRGDGWLATGDRATQRPDGTWAITGRLADTIISGGENIAPIEVEAALESHPAVAEAFVSGRRDVQWGEAVVARVVCRPAENVSAEELTTHVRAQLAAFKVPKHIEFVSALPRTASGKLRRR